MVPSGVVDELAEGRALGLALPDPKTLPWVRVRVMADAALLRIAADLDRGEREVLALAKQAADPLAILMTASPDAMRDCWGFRSRGHWVSSSERRRTAISRRCRRCSIGGMLCVSAWTQRRASRS